MIRKTSKVQTETKADLGKVAELTSRVNVMKNQDIACYKKNLEEVRKSWDKQFDEKKETPLDSEVEVKNHDKHLSIFIYKGGSLVECYSIPKLFDLRFSAYLMNQENVRGEKAKPAFPIRTRPRVIRWNKKTDKMECLFKQEDTFDRTSEETILASYTIDIPEDRAYARGRNLIPQYKLVFSITEQILCEFEIPYSEGDLAIEEIAGYLS